MITVRLQGGLGNQMFQYAVGRVLSLKNNDELFLEQSFNQHKVFGITTRQYALDSFRIHATLLDENIKHKVSGVIKRVLNKIGILVRGFERGFFFDKNITQLQGDLYLDGYWQSYKYFSGYEDEIKNDFTLDVIPEHIQTLSTKILSQQSVCIHVRRGDYVGNKKHEVVSSDYYKKAMEIIKTKMSIDTVYVFSDDIDWCKKNLSFDHDTVFVDDQYAGDNGEYHIFLMSQCKGFIIPNSTFSWWGAWLSQRTDKVVIAPSVWRNDISVTIDDLLPKEWIRI
jgi:Glycosyl transferase family 11